MEFASYLDEIESDRNGEQLSLHRQRILAAQIKDSELGDDEVLLDNADTFDNAVETSVLANESTLMEMDEVITQIQQWRQLRPMPNAELAKDDDITEHQEYHSQAYDSLFNNNGTKNWEGPETDGIDADCDFQTTATGSRKEKQYIPDEEMIQKLQSLQSLIKERQSTASKELHERHVSEYQALVKLLKSRFGDKLNIDDEEYEGDDDDECDNSDSRRQTARRNNNNNDTNDTENHNNCNYNKHSLEHAAPHTTHGNVVHPSSAETAVLQNRFHTIDLEVREGNYQASRLREEEVIQESADLQQEVTSLEDTLRDYSSDLDRLLRD